MASAGLVRQTGAVLHFRKIPRSPGSKFTFGPDNDIKCQSNFANNISAPLLTKVNIRAHFGRGTLIAMLSSKFKMPGEHA
jgi:hypothetical protein